MASIIKTDNIQKVSDDSNIIKKCGSTITIGSCGASVALATGATQTGFGRTGTVDWCTTAKTSPFTAVNGDGYFVNTTSGAVTVTLPASPSAGDIVAVSDYAGNSGSNNITVGRNSSKIDGLCRDLTLETNGIATTLVYVDGTQGWKSVSSNEITNAVKFIEATGGSVTTCGDFKIHTFTSDGTFTVSDIAAICAPTRNNVSYLVVAGGGGGGSNHSGGGGGGGFREFRAPLESYSVSPLDGNPGGTSITVTAQAYPITVGGGGSGAPVPGTSCAGSNSVFSTVTSAGGGTGAKENNGPGGDGGSGGGGTYNPARNAGGSGNTPPVSPPQGNDGGVGAPQAAPYHGGGGGGATAAGAAYNSSNGKGGNGATTSVSGSSTSYAGGGGGGGTSYSQPAGGAGGTGGGGAGTSSPSCAGTDGTANTGGGGGGGYAVPGSAGGSGGSGVVIIRYKFQ